MDNRLHNYFGSNDQIHPSADRSDVRGVITVHHCSDDESPAAFNTEPAKIDTTYETQSAETIANRWILENVDPKEQDAAFRLIEHFTNDGLEEIALVLSNGEDGRSMITQKEAKAENIKWVK